MDAIKLQKGIKTVRAIGRLSVRIESNKRCLLDNSYVAKNHLTERIKIDTAIKDRLTNYYNKNFKL